MANALIGQAGEKPLPPPREGCQLHYPENRARSCANGSHFRGNTSRRGGTFGLLLVAAILLLSGVPGRD